MVTDVVTEGSVVGTERQPVVVGRRSRTAQARLISRPAYAGTARMETPED